LTFEELHFYQVGVVDGVCMVFIVSKRLTPPFILEALGLKDCIYEWSFYGVNFVRQLP
jgi:hypothetical protein